MLLAVGVGCACAPAPLEVAPVLGDEAYAFLVVGVRGEAEVQRIDGAPVARTRRSEEEEWHLVTVPRARVAAAHALFDPTREHEVALRVGRVGGLGVCSDRGQLVEASAAPLLEFDAPVLGAELHRLEGNAWVRAEFPAAGPLSGLLVRAPIRSSCPTRRWEAEPFFARSPVFALGDQIRDFTFDRAWRRAREVHAPRPLGDGAYLLWTAAVLATARPGEAPRVEDMILPSELPPPPASWRPGGVQELAWQFQEVLPSGTSTSGSPRFLVLAQARARGLEEEGEQYGRALLELHYSSGRLQLGRVLHQAANTAPDGIARAVPLGDAGGFVVAGPNALLVQDTAESPLRSWPKLWSPISLVRVGEPDAEYFIGMSNGGFWVGDPRLGFDGLRFEVPEPGLGACERVQRSELAGESWVFTACGRTRLLARRQGTWHRLTPWIQDAPGCAREEPECGRPTVSEGRSVQLFQPAPDGGWMIGKESCPHAYSFAPLADTCARTELFELAAWREPTPGALPNEIYLLTSLEDGLVATGNGGLAVRVSPVED